ncbi:MAG: hypothetical protein AB1531_07455 [Chloroflexota bacterium]
MNRWIVVLFSLSLLFSGCARFSGQGAGTPPTQTGTASIPTMTAASTQMPSAPTLSPTPDFSSMTFVEKNELFLQLLAERQAAGLDTSEAEEVYLLSVEASFDGDSIQADQYLEQAILLLWNP